MLDDAFDQQAFASSAAALVASHVMSDAIWKTYFPELPTKYPGLRTVLIRIHQHALSGHAKNLTDTRKLVADQFDVEINTAKQWISRLEKAGFLVRLKGKKKNERKIVPSAQAKVGLFKVGQEYLACLRLVRQPLRKAMKHTDVNVSDLEWLQEIKSILDIEVKDYATE